MPIPYSLYPNRLTPDPNDHAARVRTYRGVDFEELATRIGRKGTTVGKSDILAVLEEMESVCEEVLLEGNRVLLGGLVQLFPRIKGVFTSVEDGFDPARHRVEAGANPGKRLRETLSVQAQVEKVDANSVGPRLRTFHDVASGENNGSTTPGDLGKIFGRRLRFDAGQVDEGIFFIPVDGGPELKVTSVSENRPSLLSFLIPALQPGTYRVEVRARLRDNQNLLTGRLDAPLVVAA